MPSYMKEIPNPANPNDMTAWENFKRINLLNNGIYFTSFYGSFATLLTTIGSNEATIYVNSLVTLTAGATVPSNIHLVPMQGGGFTSSSAYTLTVNGTIEHAWSQWIFGSVSLVNTLGTSRPEWFYAYGASDHSAAILHAYNSIRSSGGTVEFYPKRTYTICYGFWIPENSVTYLNGCTLFCATTFGQGTIPTNGLSNKIFAITGALTSSTLASDYENISIIGDGAIIDGNSINQSGTVGVEVPGVTGLTIESTGGSPLSANFLRVKNITVKDLTITRAIWYGANISDAENVYFRNVKSLYSGTNGISVISGRNVTFDHCEASRTIGPNIIDSNYGAGFWHEPNETWQTMENIVHIDCFASYNYGPGFRPWNPGQDAAADIYLIRCKSYRNSWDTATDAYRSSVDSSGFNISIPTGYAERYLIELEDCVAIEEYQSGFKVKRGAGLQPDALIRFKNCTALHCIQDDNNGYERAAFSVVGTSSPASAARVDIISPTIIATPTNTNGYLIGAEFLVDVHVENPSFKGPCTYNAVYGNAPSNRFTSGAQAAVFDPGADEKTGGITGSATKFFKPVRFASFDQTAEPSEIHLNEMVVWQNDNNHLLGIYINDDTLKRFIPMLNGLPGANQILKGTPTADGYKHSAVTIDESDIISGAARINLNGAVDQVSTPLNTVGNIAASGGGSINSYGVGAPGDANVERGIMVHDGTTFDVRSLAAGSGTVRPMRHLMGTNIADILGADGRAYPIALNSAPSDGDLRNGSMSWYLDQSANELRVRVRYSDGTLKTGAIALT